MQLNDLKPAWKQLKLLNAMNQIESNEILSIIASRENTNKTKLQRVLLNIVIFIVITIFCQSG